MAEEPRYLAPFRQRDFQISCAAVSFVMLLLLMCLFAGLLLRYGGDDNNDNEGDFVERIPTTPTAFAQPTAISALSSPSPTQFQPAAATLVPTPTALILIPGSGFIPGGFPTAVPIPFDPGIPPAQPPVVVIVPSNPPPPPPPPPPPSPTNTPDLGYLIVIETHGDESLYVRNRLDSKVMPLAPLRLGDGESAIEGSEWRVDVLPPGACVTAWRDKGEREEPDIDCDEMGRKLTRKKGERFWGEAFNVYYNSVLLGTCNKDKCSFTIPD